VDVSKFRVYDEVAVTCIAEILHKLLSLSMKLGQRQWQQPGGVAFQPANYGEDFPYVFADYLFFLLA
jgi:hypothetical protein